MLRILVIFFLTNTFLVKEAYAERYIEYSIDITFKNNFKDQRRDRRKYRVRNSLYT